MARRAGSRIALADAPRGWRRRALQALLLAVCVLFLTPLLWIGATSLKSRSMAQRADLLPRFDEAERLALRRERLADRPEVDPAALADFDARLAAVRDARSRLAEERIALEHERSAAGDDADPARRASIEVRLAEIDAELDRTIPLTSPDYWSGVAIQTARNYREVWTSPAADFPLYLRNSLLIALLSVTGMVLSSAIAAYGFARVRWRGRNAVFVFVLATMMIPFPVLIAPLYVLFRHLGWIGTFLPLWLPAWFGGAFSIFLLRQFFMTIPRQIDEAAMLDGCSHLDIFLRMILPLSKPALAVVALFQFIYAWNDFVGPFIFLNHQEKYTLALGLFMYQSQHGGTPWNLVMAASALIVAPVLVVFLLAQRTFIEGVATSGVKG